MAQWLRVYRSRAGVAIAFAIVIFVVVSMLRTAGLLQAMELAFYDLELRSAAGASSQEPPITLVLINEQDLRRFGHPISDDTLSELITLLLKSQVRAVGIDLYRDMPVPPARRPNAGGMTAAYRALGETVRSDVRVVMTTLTHDAAGISVPPPRFLSDDTQVGFADLPIDSAGIVRRGLLYLWEGDRAMLSFSLQLAARHLAAEGISITEAPDDPDQVKIGARVIPPLRANFGPYANVDDAGYQFLLDYSWGTRSMVKHSLGEVFAPGFDLAALRDRIVVVGTAASSIRDSFTSPLSYSADSNHALSGSLVHAHAIHQLLRFAKGTDEPLRALSAAWAVALTLGWSVLGACLGLWNRSFLVQVGLLVSAVGLLVGSAHILFGAGIWIPVVPPLFAFALAAGSVAATVSIMERAERRLVTGLFSRFIGPAVADEIWRERSRFIEAGGRPIGRRLVLTALMSDLEGYTAASEKMDPTALMSWVNEYMSSMAELVEEFGGTVEDYAGDGIKATFGFPIPSVSEAEIDDDATCAIRCALAMGARMEALNASWQARALPVGRCRVGIFTGPAVAGYLGGERSLKYTSVGDTINTAARLEGFNKEAFSSKGEESSWRILIGMETMERTRGKFDTEDMGSHALKGKDSPVAIYRIKDAVQ